MKSADGVILLDSLGDLQAENTSPILVCGSHCGGNRSLARHVKACHVELVFLNSAGVGKNQAGIGGLVHYEAEGVMACAVDHHSAEIGIAHDTWEHGIISHLNASAEAIGLQIGDSVKQAYAKIANVLHPVSLQQKANLAQAEVKHKGKEVGSKNELKQQTQLLLDGVSITVSDSITFLNENNSGDIVVCGSHGGLSAGHYAQKHGVKAVFFNDAGIGKNNAGTKSLKSLSAAGIIACTVDCKTAEIFNGQDVLNNGIISVCNQVAKSSNITEKMTVKAAIKCI